MVHFSCSRYYHSGTEMVRMAKVYLSEGNVEDAYILYIKFTTLFLEKIITHPEYKTVPVAIKQQNKATLKLVLPTLEQLKKQLLDRYSKEYAIYLARQQEADREKVRQENEARKLREQKSNENNTNGGLGGSAAYYNIPSAPPDTLLDSIVYPNDFPTDPSRSSLILPPDVQPTRPQIDRSLKPTSPDISASATGGLRTIAVPKDTMYRFLYLAAENTARNVETCGILAGKLAHNQFKLTHVIIPKQHGTPDSCTTSNEEEIFEVQDQHNLITLGWIHVGVPVKRYSLLANQYLSSHLQTHPTQTAFLSSVDLHTHCSYQMMLNEALAIVCAPKMKTNSFFCLTPDYGLDYIAQCRLEGFHPHPPEPPLFMEANHYVLDEKAAIEVVDLRK